MESRQPSNTGAASPGKTFICPCGAQITPLDTDGLIICLCGRRFFFDPLNQIFRLAIVKSKNRRVNPKCIAPNVAHSS